jgi:ketosteroid isomerase-like protein
VSEENVDLIRRAIDAYNQRDVEALLQTLDPEIEWNPALPGVLAGGSHVYRGHDGIVAMFRDFADVLDEVRFDYADIHDRGDLVVAVGEIHTRGKASGAETVSDYACVGRIRDGKGISLVGYLDPAEAMREAGLS